MLKLIGALTVIYLGWITGVIQAGLLITAAVLANVAAL